MNEPSNRNLVNPDATSLRAAIEWMRSEGLLIETEKEVNPDLEITGLQKHFDGSLPMLFNNVKGYPHARAITNLFADGSVFDRMFGFGNPTERTRKIARALGNPIKPVVIEQRDASSLRTSTSTNGSWRSGIPSWRRNPPSARVSAA